jgi:murein DD-endopeptidase MepM/ murein hydrolase activator NlpD
MSTSYKFVNRPLESGLYEPEGIYLSPPFVGQATLLQGWGANRRFYQQFRYNGKVLQGHPGVDFGLRSGTTLRAVDGGRVIEISVEPGGFERYLKLEHRWGESFYAYIDAVEVEAGQIVSRGADIATVNGETIAGVITEPHLHFAIRISPYNRFDGWGGFANPLPFMDPGALSPTENDVDDDRFEFSPPPLLQEQAGTRRP